MTKIIGIDLGTSNSAAAVLEAGRPVIIPSAEGITQYGKAFPSYVAITKDGQRILGEPARRQSVTNPTGTVSAFKRKMGTTFKYNIYGKDYSPQELSAFLLQKIKKDAEAFVGEPVTKAVITVPAYFNDNQRQATKDAGEIAGLEVVRLVNEPTAACLAYGLDKAGKDMKILVFDLGGGTLDVTIMDFGGGIFEVKSTSGDTQLGGTDMDKVVTEFLVDEFRKQTNMNIDKNDESMMRMKEAAEKAKIELSTTLNSEINLPYLFEKHHFKYNLTRAKLEDLIRPIVERCRTPVERAMKDAKLTAAQVDKIILVGGPTRMPIVQKFVEDVVGKKVEHGVDPMECVAKGAAVQAGVLAGEVKDVLLLDVTPLSLGIETLGGIFTKQIERNTTIPSKKSQVFSTAADSQPAVDIHVLQGERPMAKDNVSLGKFQLVGIPPAPRGVPQIEVTFDIDANGILHVSAKDLGTGKEQSMRITAPNKMKDDEIKRKMKEAEEYSEEDRQELERVQAKNEGESLVYTAEKTLKDLADKIPEDSKKRVQEAADKLKESLKTDDTAKIKADTEELTKIIQEVGTHIYQQGQQKGEGEGQAGEGSEKNDENVVDADYTKVEDDKKKK
ncbi:MAG: molecular chaperone DnaK [Candidatus Micrarchaeota archaeon]